MSDSPPSAPLPEIIKGTSVRLPRARTRTSNEANIPKKGRGRPRGAMNKEKVAVREFSRDVLLDPVYQRNVAKVIKRFNPDEIKKISSIVILMHYYAFGRPKHTVQVEAPTRGENSLAGRSREEVRELYSKAAELRALRDGKIVEMRPVAFEPVPDPEKAD